MTRFFSIFGNKKNKHFAFLAGITLTFLAGCSMYEETRMTPNKIRVEEASYSETFKLNDLNDTQILAISRQYERYGDGPMLVNITYDPASKTNTAMEAGNTASKLAHTFNINGVNDISANILPIKNSGDQSQVMVSYRSYTAKGPEDCTMMPSYDGSPAEIDEEYELGCSVKTTIAKQVSRPKDLLGKEQKSPYTDARRAGNIAGVRRTGQPNPELGGESASQ